MPGSRSSNGDTIMAAGRRSSIERSPTRPPSPALSLKSNPNPHAYSRHVLSIDNESGLATFAPVSHPLTTSTFDDVLPGATQILSTCCTTCHAAKTEHKLHQHAYSPAEQQTIASSLRLPGFPFTKTLRRHAKGVGNFDRRLEFDEHDDGRLLSFTVSYHRSMRQFFHRNRGAVWGMYVRYRARDHAVVGLVDNLLPGDRARLQVAMRETATLRGHPLHVLCALVRVQVEFALEAAQDVYGFLYDLEHEHGIARGKKRKARWTLSEKGFKEYVSSVQREQVHLLYLQRQVDLLLHFLSLLEELDRDLNACVREKTLDLASSAHRQGFSPARQYAVRECLGSLRGALLNIADNIRMSEKRAQAGLGLVNNLMSNAEVQASSHYTAIGTTIAIVTLLFLPLTAVSTFFSMGFFRFDDNGKLRVSQRLWIFFALAIPLTVALLLLLISLMYRRIRGLAKVEGAVRKDEES